MAEGYRLRLTDFLSRLMCRSRFANGAVATGVARRSMAQGFKGDMPAIHDRLKAADCPASATVGPRMMRELGAAADLGAGNRASKLCLLVMVRAGSLRCLPLQSCV